MPIVGCYALDLYCDTNDRGNYGVDCPHYTYQRYPEQFNGPNERDCMTQARKVGWTFRNHKAYCPECSKDRNK